MKILVCYDGSGSARDALALAKKHALVFEAEVIVVYSLVGGGDTDVDDVDRANGDLEYAKKVLDSEGIRCETKLLVHGVTPGEDIVEYAREKAVEEIIIGVRRRSKVGKLLFGSNAQYVILNAHCPVVTVK